jgi:acyl carrier protein
MVDESRLKRVLANIFGVPEESLDETSSQDNVPTWDSLHHMNLVLALEEEFGVIIPDEDAANMMSYKLIRIVLDEQLAGKKR